MKYHRHSAMNTLPKNVVDYIYTHVLHRDYVKSLIHEYRTKMWYHYCTCTICNHGISLKIGIYEVFTFNDRRTSMICIGNINRYGGVADLPKNYF